MENLVIGIDVGGQSSKLGVVNAKGEILEQCVISSLQDNLNDYLKDLSGAIKDLVAKTKSVGTVKGLGIGAPNSNY